jgi:hypothetical protein
LQISLCLTQDLKLLREQLTSTSSLVLPSYGKGGGKGSGNSGKGGNGGKGSGFGLTTVMPKTI